MSHRWRKDGNYDEEKKVSPEHTEEGTGAHDQGSDPGQPQEESAAPRQSFAQTLIGAVDKSELVFLHGHELELF